MTISIPTKTVSHLNEPCCFSLSGKNSESTVPPKYAEIAVGDTIVTTNYSSRFPPGLMIGTVESFALQEATYYDVRVRLASPIGALRNVCVVRYADALERNTLENEVTGEIY